MRYLEAFPNNNFPVGEVVRPRQRSKDLDQIWSIRYSNDGYYHITCDTRNGGLRYLEAFPNNNFPVGDVIRPRQRSEDNQDQKWIFVEVED